MLGWGGPERVSDVLVRRTFGQSPRNAEPDAQGDGHGTAEAETGGTDVPATSRCWEETMKQILPQNLGKEPTPRTC